MKLNTFVLVHKNNIISPILTTTREYGRWFEDYFDSSICNMEIYMKSKTKDGEVVLESHPGTKIGRWFDKNEFSKSVLHSWFILQDSSIMNKLVKYKLAEQKDAIPISVNDSEHRNMIRVYTVEQISMYLKANVDSSFYIGDCFLKPRQIKVSDSDLEKLIMPKVENRRKKLF